MFEGKIFRQVPTFMVAPQQEESGWVGNFQRPQVEDALNTQQCAAAAAFCLQT